MKNFLKTLPFLLLIFLFTSSFITADKKNVKCLIQLTNYSGEGAYVVVSLLDPKGNYEETLYVQGKDSEWYSEIGQWWSFYGQKKSNIDGISGATVSGGGRTVSLLKISEDKIDKGYSIRFETSVEDQKYYTADLEFELTTANLKSKKEGTGFIRYVRMLPQ
ncbi:DUF2271 domain-containing protein [Nonlabens antarcticus]|uniref:DUF2271 domain-containing protein n=1 Tax=Nonlabens antarcticus TaxID=392714 RepID=UPI0018912A3A|nr:DUF2271 domain-containing protein [Nonlabens antarcticus]